MEARTNESHNRNAGLCPENTPDTHVANGSQAVLWSHRYDVINGQAIVTQRVAERQPDIDWIKAVYSSSLLSVIRATVTAWKSLFGGGVRVAYVVCSRSIGGFLRDLPILSVALLGRRVVAHTHGTDLVWLLTESRLRSIARVFYRRCEVIVPSSHLIGDLRSRCREVHLCENFSTGESYPALSSGNTAKTFRILWNSNVIASKGYCELIEAVRLVRAEGHPLRLTVLGQVLGDHEKDQAEMRKFLDSFRSEDWIDIRGPVPPEEAERLVWECDLVPLPSRYNSECQPLALIQAMCAGRLVLITESAALRATVGDYPAFVAQHSSVASVSDALRRAAACDEAFKDRLSKAASVARERFSADRFDCQIEKIIKNRLN